MRAVASPEDGPEEIGMCLADQAPWATYLRFSEISDHDDVRLRSLQAASLDVDAGGITLSISLMDLRPGIGSARLEVPPSTAQYNVKPKGSWPLTISQEPWQTAARGLNPRGTVFRLRRREWVQLKQVSAVELGDELRVVAESRNTPPGSWSPESAEVVTHNGRNWQMWRVLLPHESSFTLERWAEYIGLVLLEPAWN